MSSYNKKAIELTVCFLIGIAYLFAIVPEVNNVTIVSLLLLLIFSVALFALRFFFGDLSSRSISYLRVVIILAIFLPQLLNAESFTELFKVYGYSVSSIMWQLYWMLIIGLLVSSIGFVNREKSVSN